MKYPIFRRTTVAAATVLAAVLTVTACGPVRSSARPASSATQPSSVASGDFGSAKGVCGPGTPKGSSARGVTPTSIQVGVLNDVTSQLQPGLGQEYLDTAKAFVGWCNAAGGINGRTIRFVSRDARMTEAPARIFDACRSDFMLVGGATPLDDATVRPRLACGLGSIPAYAASAATATSQLLALANHGPSREANVLLVRRLLERQPTALRQVAYTALDAPSLLVTAGVLNRAINQAGVRSSLVRVPIAAAGLQSIVAPLVGRASAMVVAPGDPTALFRAMTDVGFQPDLLLDVLGTAYTPVVTDALRAVPAVTAPFYSQTYRFPLELADQNPATKLAVGLVGKVSSYRARDPEIVNSFAAWILWAQSATACGDDLTVQCVIDRATAQHSFDAGGLTAPVDVADPLAVPPCSLIQRVSAAGFTYDRELTRPTQGVFNCDPGNVVSVVP
ncbi:ABC transporter substrate-binding protein [Frankia sp. R82]|uniref:ABC transporter substrate-binding protein n=1 Tax=Frankia sp. R82 TaxID=2950553 RepID=UPI0020436911|nr:ABC transporter substrate-binding protein [Frankia sp. R82]MCM3886859.1 ABC transporter substrate-binding protein [Frankia sp. R82]